MASGGLEVRGLRGGYGRLEIIHGLDLDVHQGEIVGMLGPNGAGKTTSILGILGLTDCMGGEVRLNDQRIASGHPERAARLGIGHVPEGRSLFSQLTVRENLRVATASRTEIARVLELFPALGELLGRRAGVLSGGEQQMLCLARALVRRPRFLLVDEMSLGLAPIIVQTLLETLRRSADEEGMGVLLVEQHVELALSVADRGVVLHRGAVRLTGSADELRTNRAAIEGSYLGDQVRL